MAQKNSIIQMEEKRLLSFIKYSNIYKLLDQSASNKKNDNKQLLKTLYIDYEEYLCNIYFDNLTQAEQEEIEEEIKSDISLYLEKRNSVTYKFFFNRAKKNYLSKFICPLSIDQFIKVIEENRKFCISKFELSKLTEKKAQELFEERTKNDLPGDSISDWLRAEQEIKNKYIVVI